MYLTVFWISLVAWLLFESWVYLRDRGKEQADASKAGRGARGVFIALAIAISLAMNVPGIAPMLDFHRNFAVLFFIGIALVWAGLLLRFWSIQTLGRLFSTRLVIQEKHALITAGPYRVLRNPSYTGGLMTMIGFGLSLGNGLSLAILLVTGMLVYVLRIRTEEKMLGEAFGEKYEEYKKRSWRLIPFVW